VAREKRAMSVELPATRRTRPTFGEVAAPAVFLVAIAPVAYRAVMAATVDRLVVLAPAALLGVLTADLASGVVHWACDTFFAENTPVIGQAVIAPFRDHHRDPLALTRRTFLDASSSNFVGATVVLLAAWGLASIAQVAGSPFFVAWATSQTVALGVTNQVHKWAHQADVPRIVAWLHACRLILTPAGHGRHHASGEGAFCITVGWLNPALDRLGVFAALERGVGSLARRCIALRSGRVGTSA